jgi:DNA-binding protein H-NS
MLLGTRANPIYRPIILGYQEIVSALARKKTHRITRRLEQLASARRETGNRMEKIDDYLNWFEATQSQTRSGTFAEYLKTAGRSDDPEPRRRDAISVYLDVLEAQFQ